MQHCNVSTLGGYHRIPKNLLYSATQQQQQPVGKHRKQRNGHQSDNSTDSDDIEFMSATAFPLHTCSFLEDDSTRPGVQGLKHCD